MTIIIFVFPIFSTDHLFLLNLNKQISISLKDHFSPVVNEIEKVHPPQFSIFAERLYRTKFQLASKNRDEILKCSIKIPPWNRDCPSSLRLSRLYRIRRYWNKWKGRRNKLKLPENSSLNDLLRNFHRFSTVSPPPPRASSDRQAFLLAVWVKTLALATIKRWINIDAEYLADDDDEQAPWLRVYIQ